MEDRRGERHGALPRLVGVHRPAGRVFTARTILRAGSRLCGSRVRPRHHALVASEERRPQRQVQMPERRSDQGGRRLLHREFPLRRPMRSSTNWTPSPRRTKARWLGSRWPGSRRMPGVTSTTGGIRNPGRLGGPVTSSPTCGGRAHRDDGPWAQWCPRRWRRRRRRRAGRRGSSS